jgi:hypothetical protein
MEAKAFCAYNLTRDSFLSVKVIVTDPVCAPSSASGSAISELECDPESSLWLTPLTEAPQFAGFPRSDLVYLDRNNRVLEAIDLAAGADLPPFGRHAASALILPQGTLQSTRTRLGDQLTVCDDMRMVAHLRRLSFSTAAYSIPESSNTAPEQSLNRHFLCETIPVHVTITESPYEQFPSPLLFMPSITDADLNNAGFRFEGPQNPLLFTAHVITQVTVAPDPFTEELQNPVVPTPEEILPDEESTETLLDESAQELVAAPESPSEAIQNSEISVPDESVPAVEDTSAQAPALQAVDSASIPADGPDPLAVAQSPAAESDATATLPQNARKRLHSQKRFFKRPRKSQEQAEFNPRPVTESLEAQVTPIPASADPAGQKDEPAVDLPSVPSFALPLPVEILMSTETTAHPDLESPIRASEDLTSGSDEVTNQDEPHFFVPDHIRFFDPVKNASVETSADAVQERKEEVEANSSPVLSQALRDLIVQLTEQEKERQKQKQQSKKEDEPKKHEDTEIVETPAAFSEPEVQLAAFESQSAEPPREEAEPAWTEEAKFQLQVTELRKKKAKKEKPVQVPEIAETAEQAESQAEEKRRISARLQSWLETRNVQKAMGPDDRRKSSRVREPGLVAFYFTGGTPRPYPIEHISETGFYVHTKDHWLPQTMLLMTIQRPDRKLGDPLHAITVLAKVVRNDSHGVGHEFIMTESLPQNSLDIIPDMGTDKVALTRFLQPLQ